jgi:amino acid transporter
MLEKGFIRNQNNRKSKHHQLVAIISKVMLYLGAVILIGSFAYLFYNYGKSNFLIGMIAPFLVAGLGLIFISQLIRRAYKRLR